MSMSKEALEARRAYKRRWAKEHPESVRASQEKYWNKKAQELEAAKEADKAEATV